MVQRMLAPPNKAMKQTKLSAAPWLAWRCRLMPAEASVDAGTASQLIAGVRRTPSGAGARPRLDSMRRCVVSTL